MLNKIISVINNTLKEAGAENVCSAFDCRSLEQKGRKTLVVTSVDKLECSTPVFTEYFVYMPFRADVGITLAAPLSEDSGRLFDYFERVIAPAFGSLGSLDCRLTAVSVKKDSNINRLVLKAVYSAKGIQKTEREAA